MIHIRTRTNVLYPNPTHIYKFIRTKPRVYYKLKPKSEIADPNANMYPNAILEIIICIKSGCKRLEKGAKPMEFRSKTELQTR